jgi:hypothetical protein
MSILHETPNYSIVSNITSHPRLSEGSLSFAETSGMLSTDVVLAASVHTRSSSSSAESIFISGISMALKLDGDAIAQALRVPFPPRIENFRLSLMSTVSKSPFAGKTCVTPQEGVKCRMMMLSAKGELFSKRNVIASDFPIGHRVSLRPEDQADGRARNQMEVGKTSRLRVNLAPPGCGPS